jgi:LDH2 family malate/lactate/ureidoglycolate dehydrogenase
MRGFVYEVFMSAGTSPRDARTMARLLVEQDMAQNDAHPGSHGTRTMTDFAGEGASPGWQNYVRRMLADPPPPYAANEGSGTGRVNPRPQVSVVSQTPTARVYDGDGGLGHICAVEATEWASEETH